MTPQTKLLLKKILFRAIRFLFPESRAYAELERELQELVINCPCLPQLLTPSARRSPPQLMRPRLIPHRGPVHYAELSEDLDVSVVTYNSAKWLPDFFQSLVEQYYPKRNISLFITDNGSTDDTLSTLEHMSRAFGQQFKSMTLFQRKNLGFGRGHNNNLHRSASRFILVTNVDLVFERESIALAMMQAARSGPEVAAWEFRQKPFEHPKYYDPITLKTPWSSSACVLFRRNLLEAVNGYDPRIFMYGEDVEISYRIRSRGFDLEYCPRSVVWHYCYERENDVKPLQFSGSLFANSLIRLRYGKVHHILEIPFMYLGLMRSSPVVPNQRMVVLKNVLAILRRAPGVLISRRQSSIEIGIRGWDYEITRHGAFHRAHQSEIENLPMVTIITRTHEGRLGWLEQSTASVINQTYPNIELVVVEDGTELASHFVKSVGTHTGLRTTYKSIPKSGRSRAGNVGMALATGEWLMFLDDDDALFADHIETLMDEALANPKLAGVYSLAWEVYTDVRSVDPLDYQESNYVLCKDHVRPFCAEALLERNFIPIQSLIFRRFLYETYGGFREDLDALEDWNLWIRYSRSHEFLLVEKITSIFRTPANSTLRKMRQDKLDSVYHDAKSSTAATLL